MQLVVICNESQKAELINGGVDEKAVRWTEGTTTLLKGDAVIDLLFENTSERLAALAPFSCVIVNSVVETLSNMDRRIIRINGWTTFLKGSLIEAAGSDSVKNAAEQVFDQLGKKIEWLPDEPGFITLRVISMIINEAYFALAEGVSTKEEIDTALKLGTAYPFGPFEWSQQIGLRNIAQLLTTLAGKEPRYQPCSLLLQEATI